MKTARTIVLAATITALSSLASPAQAGDVGGGGDGGVAITADECTGGGGSVVDDSSSSTGRSCSGGNPSVTGAEVSG